MKTISRSQSTFARASLGLEAKWLLALSLGLAITPPAALRAAADEAQAGPSQDLEMLSQSFRRASAIIEPSIVTVETHSGPRETPRWSSSRLLEDEDSQWRLDEIAQRSALNPSDGTGTGIIIDERGYILTCNHVVEAADTVFVRLQDGRRLEATRILKDPMTDIAVVQVGGAHDLPVASLGTASDLQVGDWVLTVGNPYGLGLSVSTGVVSATHRHLPDTPYMPLIQTDAASNPGNSGGALVNLCGEVVGVSEGGYGAGAGFQGIGFAIPIDMAHNVARKLIKHGEVIRPYFGIETELMTADLSDHLGMKQGGLIVCDVEPGSPADAAGIETGDVLTHIEKSPIDDNCEFFRLTQGLRPGRPVRLTIFRDGSSVAMQVSPTELGANGLRQKDRVANETGSNQGYMDKATGIAVDDLSVELARRLGYQSKVDGVAITFVAPGSIAAKQGLRAGMAVFRVDDEPTETVEQYREATRDKSLDDGMLLLLGTGRRKHYALLKE